MLWLALGALTLFLFLGGLRAFERASVTTLKSLGAWIAALAGVSLALLLILTGRGGIALGALTLFGPLIYQRWQAYRMGRPSAGPGPSAGQAPPPRRAAGMTREEALQVLGLQPGASEAEIRAAHHRLMRGAHPDSGGSDWPCSRCSAFHVDSP